MFIDGFKNETKKSESNNVKLVIKTKKNELDNVKLVIKTKKMNQTM